jgi:DnaK suppressor protein
MKQGNARAKKPKNYQTLLLAKKLELSSNLRANLGTLTGPGGAALDDLAPVLYDQFIALRINNLDYLQLKLIEEALARIDSEEYGVCADCGNAIARARLEAIPWAVRCIACQELFGSDSDSSSVNDPAPLEKTSAR